MVGIYNSSWIYFITDLNYIYIYMDPLRNLDIIFWLSVFILGC